MGECPERVVRALALEVFVKDRNAKLLELPDKEGLHLHALLTRLMHRQDAVGDLMQELVTSSCL